MKPLILSLLSVLSVLSAFALTDAWSLDLRQHTAIQRTYKQGESWDIAVTLRDGLKPLDLTNATAALYYYTNATDNIWWTNSAALSGSTLTTSWTPAMDVGAPVYYYWIGLWPSGSTSPLWRVTGTLRLLPSPGFTPNAILPPVRFLDFSSVALTNAPWSTAADLQAASNALAVALRQHTNDSASHLSEAQAARIAAALTNANAFVSSTTNFVTGVQGTNGWWTLFINQKEEE